MEREKVFFGKLLVKEGLLSAEQLEFALAEQRKTGELLGVLLTRMKLISEESLARILSRHFGIDYVDLTVFKFSAEVLKLIPAHLARKFGAIPLEKKGNKLTVAISNPQDSFVIDGLKQSLSFDIEPKITTASNINYAWRNFTALRRS